MKVIQHFPIILLAQVFQFLIGSMKVVSNSAGGSATTEFQFLIGSMKGGLVGTMAAFSAVSIPYRFNESTSPLFLIL